MQPMCSFIKMSLWTSSILIKNLGRGLSNLAGIKVNEQTLKLLKSNEGGSVDLEINKEKGTAVITLNYAQKRNSMSGSMMVDLEERISELEKWEDGWGLILRGAGGTFCSGGNLQFQKSLSEKIKFGHPAIISEYMQMALERLQKLPFLSVAVLEGATLGGGSEIALSCDFRIMSNSATFGFPEGKLGLCVGWGGSVKLVNLVGRITALKLLASCAILKSDEALAIGLVDDVCSNSMDPMDVAYEFLKKFSKLSPEVLRATKIAVLRCLGFDNVSVAYELERNTYQHLTGGPAHLDFLKKLKK